MPDSANHPLTTVGIFLTSYLGPFMMDLAAVLRRERGSTIHLYCKTEQQANHYRASEHAGTFASIQNFVHFWEALRAPDLDSSAEFFRARSWEAKLNVTINTLAVANRHVGLGYALGGFRHPRSRYGDSSYLQMVHAYNVQIGYLEHELRTKGITSVISDNKEVAMVCRYLGIPFRTMARSRWEGLHYWEEAEHREAKAWQRSFSQIPQACVDDDPAKVVLPPPYVVGKVFIERAMRNANWTNVAKGMLHYFARHVYWVIKGYEKAKGYYLGEQLSRFVRQKRDIRRMVGSETTTLAKLAGTPFVFYPLHTEPEQALGQISPEFFFQLEAIAAVSRDLPAGVKLAVKEVPNACGRRPDNFYDQILRLKNVAMINLAEKGTEVIRESIGVVTIAGTAGLEAAAMGKPVISFGHHNPFNFLDHVWVVRDLTDLPALVQRMVNQNFDTDKARRDGLRLIEAIRMSSFDMGPFDYINLERFPSEASMAAYDKLLESFEYDEARQPISSTRAVKFAP